MRNLLITIIALTGIFCLAFLTSCGCNGTRGNKHVVTRERTVSPFSKISIEGVFPVELSQDGGSEAVKVETDENLQDLIIVHNEGDKLIVEMKENSNINRSSKMKVYINVKNLDELENKSVGTIISNGTLKTDSFQLMSESVGKLELTLEGKYLHVDLKAVGTTTLKGKVDEVRINNKSVGALRAYDLKAGKLMIHNTGVGSTEIYADNEFYIRSESIGTLYYKGPGVVKELNSTGIGKVKKAED